MTAPDKGPASRTPRLFKGRASTRSTGARLAGVWDFTLPEALVATEPAEERGLDRDGVRLMVTREDSSAVEHRVFADLDEVLKPGDLLVVNTSGTRNAALSGVRYCGSPVTIHLSTWIEADFWVVELRENQGAAPLSNGQAGEVIQLGADDDPESRGRITLLSAYAPERLWIAEIETQMPVDEYCARFGRPIRYAYVTREWPSSNYQTVFSRDRGSSEMPSAGRPFTARLLARLEAKGVEFAEVSLHTGVASLEAHERPYPERYEVSAEAADRINRARSEGRRVIAVGTTCVRAVETVADEDGYVTEGRGWTSLVLSPERPMRAIDGLITGLHEPGATHLAMLRALASEEHLQRAYNAAIAEGYLWHEFGDSHLILR